MRGIDALFAAGTAVLGAWIAYTALNYGYSTAGNPGPGFFPFWVGLLIAALGAMNMLRAVLRTEVLSEAFEWNGFLKTAGISIAIALFLWFSPWIGMLLGSAVLILVTGTLIRPQWNGYFTAKLAAIAAGFPIAAYLIFSVYLGVRLVEGGFGF